MQRDTLVIAQPGGKIALIGTGIELIALIPLLFFRVQLRYWPPATHQPPV